MSIPRVERHAFKWCQKPDMFTRDSMDKGSTLPANQTVANADMTERGVYLESHSTPVARSLIPMQVHLCRSFNAIRALSLLADLPRAL